MTDQTPGHPHQEPPSVSAARRPGEADGQEHAEPGDDWPTLCGIPADQVVMYRHLFHPDRSDACPHCAERIWRLDPPGPFDTFVSLIWIDDAPALRMTVRARSAQEARELLKLSFGDSTVVSVWSEEAANRPPGVDFVSEPARMAAADQVVVIAGAGYDAKDGKNYEQLATERAPEEIIAIASLLADYQPGEHAYWMEWPAISLVFLKDSQPLAECGLLSGGTWVRTPTAGDRQVRHPERLRTWLHEHGLSTV